MKSQALGPNMIGLVSLQEDEETLRSLSLPQRKGHVRTQREGGHLKAREFSPELTPDGTLTLGFPFS